MFEITKDKFENFVNFFEPRTHVLTHSLQNLKDLLALSKSDRGQVIDFLGVSINRFHVYVSQKSNQQKQRDAETEDRILAKCVERAKELEVEDLFNQISELVKSKVKADDPTRNLLYKPHQALISAHIVKHLDSAGQYVQVDFGHGKTYVMLMAAQHMLSKLDVPKVTIVVPIDELVEQMTAALDSIDLDLLKINVCTKESLPDRVEGVLIIDEAFDELMKSKVCFTAEKKHTHSRNRSKV